MADQHRSGLGPDRRSLRAPTLPEALNKYRRHSFMVGADRSALATAADRKTRSAGLEVRHFAAKGVEGAVCVCALCRISRSSRRTAQPARCSQRDPSPNHEAQAIAGRSDFRLRSANECGGRRAGVYPKLRRMNPASGARREEPSFRLIRPVSTRRRAFPSFRIRWQLQPPWRR